MLEVSGQKISKVTEIPADETLPMLFPPLVDLQQNGALGTYFTNFCNEDPENLNKVADFLRKHGVGRVQLTTTTASINSLKKSLSAIDKKLSAEPELESLFYGIFHEGVFISPRDGWRGAHPAEHILFPDYAMFERLNDASGNRIKTVNVAPEEPGGLAFISKAVSHGFTVAIGHCCPDNKVVKEAVKLGASLVTHFANGAAPNIHRFKNPFWSFLDEPDLKLGLICDGFHLPPEVVGTAFKCKGTENCFVVSDASGYSGYPPGLYERDNNRSFEIRADGLLHLAGQEILMGAWFQLDRGVEFLVKQLNMPLTDAWRQCSEIPAKIAGIKLPVMQAGENADFVLASWDDGLVIEQTVFNGKQYLDSPYRPDSTPMFKPKSKAGCSNHEKLI